MTTAISRKRVIQLYYGFQFFFSLLLWLPVFYEYQKRIGLSDSQIFSIQSIYYWVFCFLEIPTGLSADRWGYRFCMRAGSLVLVAAGVFPLLALPVVLSGQFNYAAFLAHFLLIALARSLISGAASAYLYDYLRTYPETHPQTNPEEDGSGSRNRNLASYKQIEGNARAYGLVGKIILWPAMSVLMERSLASPYVLTLVANVVAVVFAFLMPQLDSPPIEGDLAHQSDTTDLWRNLLAVFRVLFRTPILLLIMIQGVAIFTLSRIVQVNLFQPLLTQKSFSLNTHGAVMSFMTIFETLGSFWPRFRSVFRWSDLNTVFGMTLIMAFSLLGIEGSGVAGTLVGLGVFSFVTGAAFPVQKQLINDAIPNSHFRATLLSIESIIDRAACAWVAGLISSALVTGGMESASHGKMNEFLKVSSWVSVLSVIVLYFLIRLIQKEKAKKARTLLVSENNATR